MARIVPWIRHRLPVAVIAAVMVTTVSSCVGTVNFDYDNYLIDLCLYNADTDQNLRSAEKFYWEALALMQRNDTSNRRSEALSGLAECLYEQDKQSEAASTCMLALDSLKSLPNLVYLRMRNLLLLSKLPLLSNRAQGYLDECLNLSLPAQSGAYLVNQFHHERAEAFLLRTVRSTSAVEYVVNLQNAITEAAIGTPDQGLYDRLVQCYLKLSVKARGDIQLKSLTDSLNYRVIIDRLEARLTFEDRWNRAITESDKEPDVERALTMLAQAQRAAEEFGDQRRVAMSLSKRAYLLMNSGRAGAAKVLYQQALAIVEKVHGKHSAFTALEYTNMGDVCVRLSQFQEALRYHRMADAIYCTKPGVAEVNRKYIRDVIVRDLKCLHGERVRAQHLQREGM